MKRFQTFQEIVKSQDSNNVALKYFSHQKVTCLKYGELLSKIESFPLPQENVIGILADLNITTIIAIFALASKRQIVLLNPQDDIEILKRQVKATSVSLLIGDDDELVEELNEALEPDLNIKDTNILFFTSGTTSSSKAVILDEEKLCSAAYNGGYCLPLNEDDRLFECSLPLSHVFGFVCALLWPLSFGSEISLSRGLPYIFEDIKEFKPTVMSLVPQLASFFALKKLFNPELKLVLIGAGDCSKDVLMLIKSLGIRVSFGYGLTESSSGIALSLGEDPKAMTICPDYQVEIAEDGEIIASSKTTLMKGYYKDEKGTDEVLKGDKLYTGDLGKIENDLLYITGRKKDILVLNDGTKIFLPEYEANLTKLLGPTSDFTVLQDEANRIILYIYSENKVDDIVATFNEKYPRGQRISQIIYAKNKLPRTKTNKVQKYMIKF